MMNRSYKLLVVFSFVLFFNTFRLLGKEDTLRFHYGELVITALRYPERIIEVPLSVSYITSKDFPIYRGLSIDEPLTQIPGVLAQSRSGSQDVRITIRGFGSRGAGDRSNSGTVRGLKFLLDGIPQTEPDGRTSLDFFDISAVEKIEIIRSNASALWGNAAGGVLSFNTFPTEYTPLLSYSTAYGRWGLKKNVLKLRSNLGSSGIVYLNTIVNSFDGWRDNSQSEKIHFNFGVGNLIDNKTNIKLNINLVKNLFHIPGAITKKAYDTLPTVANPTYFVNKERRNNRIAQIGVSLDHSFDKSNSLFFQGFLTSKFLQRSERGTFRDFTRYFLGSTLFYQNLIEASNFTNIFLAGLDQTLQDGAILFYALDSNANRSNQLRTNKKEGAQTFGAFLQNEFQLRMLSILLGVRFDQVEYDAHDFLKFTWSDEKTFSRLTPKLGVSFQPTNNFSIFANLGGGIEVPAGNEVDPAPGDDTLFQINPLLSPIISTTYEFGAKSFVQMNSIIRTIELEASTYFIDTKNELIPYREGRFYLSAGRTTRLGFETYFKLIFPLDINFAGTFTYLFSKFNDYKVDSSFYDKNKKNIFADFRNNQIPGVPNYFYNFSLTIPFYLNFQISLNGVSKYFADDANKIEVPSYNILNAKVWFDNIFIKLGNTGNSKIQISLGLGIDNLLDTKYIASAFINPLYEKQTNLPYFIEPGLPRNLTFNLSVRY
ncbi:MAG: TonB-dependent receptor [Ignavibacteria bacterium]|nr:TonB-dependent receptor [Ignavibacteria bacterium]